MQLFQYTIIAVLGLGLAAAVALVYVVLRYSAWTPAGGTPAASARMHGMVTALIALFATGTAGADRILGVGTGGLLLLLALTSAMATPTWAALIQPGTHYRIGAPTEAVIYASLGSFVALAVAALLMFTWPVPRLRPAKDLPESAGQLAHGVRP